ncbi:MAG TPA: YggT family protein [Candidatus Nitrosotalea sp.]|nr:YggT family protein [Candidatus Nitrosotalea sp.]
MYQPSPQQRPDSEGMPPATTTPVAAGGYVERSVVRTAQPGAVAANLVYLIFALIEGLIAIRVVMKLLAADPAAAFARAIYGLTQPLVEPFKGLFQNPIVAGVGRIEVNSLFAIVIYALIGWVLARLVALAFNQTSRVSVNQVDGPPGPR